MLLRNLVLLLLFTNVLMIAWQLWIVPPDHPDPYSHADASIPTLELVKGEPPAASPQTPERDAPLDLGTVAELEPQAEPAMPSESCLRVGPFTELAVANQVREQLLPQADNIERISEPGEAWVGHWVQIIGLPDRAAAEAAVANLVDAGIADAYIVQFAPTLDISLGVYRSLERANNVIGMASRLGYAAVMEDRVRPTVEHWLVAILGPNEALNLDDVSLAAGQILRSEQIICDARNGTEFDAEP